jgi:uncharacterized protein YndB with AHSA1/START domain
MKTIDITLSRTIPASPDAVYDVWIDPKSPGGPWFGSPKAVVQPKVDGLFYLPIEHQGRTFAHYGRFVALERPTRIEHTWMSEPTRGLETVVTITLEARNGKTELTLKHAGVPDDEEGRKHKEGWGWMLGELAKRFGAAD